MNLREARLRQYPPVNQNRLAMITGIPQPYISAFENGDKLPTTEQQAKIAEALGCKVEDIF